MLRVGDPDHVSPRTLPKGRSQPPGPSPDLAAGARHTYSPGWVSSPRWNQEGGASPALQAPSPGPSRNQGGSPRRLTAQRVTSASPAVLRWAFCPRSLGWRKAGRSRSARAPDCLASTSGPARPPRSPRPGGNSQPQGEPPQETPSRAGRGRRLVGRQPPRLPAL
ncbi:hypothetical protein NDU88_003070 [Pleurodeles waltl]|uniref:Uncharacterized protein n=1 Tax=Pleurodeles waltl TaxID=8319 RepID=A0AAV7LR19_PLEWA|nr:hypothetical protein NDU88_003070 [Pleurodeles waltl]